ncbi:MAG: hypothetical protein KKE29_21420 [Proteobacteria bacterium]|nr:hypothetical protein [Pseudomonadota bacterium]MBU4577165.1 hypothetical protein [Pseudomonadota bacterium]MBU4599133.1 hypothetical protein [Pseudomonadota bacterium]
MHPVANQEFIDIFDRAYGFNPRGPRLSAYLGAAPFSYQVLRSGLRPLIVYSITNGFTGPIQHFVPIKESLSRHQLCARIKQGPTSEYDAPAWADSMARVLTKPGFSIFVHSDLRCEGVVSRYDYAAGKGLIRANAPLNFCADWIVEGRPKVGSEVEYMPLVRVGRGFQARLVSVISRDC